MLFSTNVFCQKANFIPDSILYVSKYDNLLNKIDPILYNGIIYKSTYPRSVIGNQYLRDPNFIKGTATIKGIKFNDIDLNYDIYKQELLLKVSLPTLPSTVIMVSKAWLEDFSLGDSYFKIYKFPKSPDRIYQVIGDGSVKILYYWKKDLKLNNAGSSTEQIFTSKREQNLQIGNEIKKYHGNRSFVHLFEKGQQGTIKKYLKENKIRVNKASDKVIKNLIIYCNNLIQ